MSNGVFEAVDHFKQAWYRVRSSLMRIEHVQIRRIVPGEDPRAWTAALEESGWLQRATVLKQDAAANHLVPPAGEQMTTTPRPLFPHADAAPGHWVRRATLAGRDVVVKCRPIGSLAERLKLVIQHDRGDRHWKGATWLARHGFRTASPYVMATAALNGEAVELLVMEALAGQSVLEHLAAADLGVRQEHAVAAALGQMIMRLSGRQHYNRDSKPSNLMVIQTTDGPEIAIIDSVAIRPSAQAEQMFASLVIEPIDQGCPPRRALMMRALRAAAEELRHGPAGLDLDDEALEAIVRTMWRATAARVERHFQTRGSARC